MIKGMDMKKLFVASLLAKRPRLETQLLLYPQRDALWYLAPVKPIPMTDLLPRSQTDALLLAGAVMCSTSGSASTHTGSNWAQPSISHLRRLMRRVVSHPQESNARGKAARERMVREYSPEALGPFVAQLLRRADARIPQ
eukprot:181358-Pelagomonas_calceolata.AAC.2